MDIKPYVSVLLTLFVSVEAGLLYNVYPSPGSIKHDHLTLQDYARDSQRYFTSNTAFVLLSGRHYLNSTLTMKNVSNLTLQGVGSKSWIILQSKAYVHCIKSNGITLKSLNIIGKGLASSLLEIKQSFLVALIDTTISCYCEFHGNGARGIEIFKSDVKCFNCRINGGFSDNGGAVYAKSSNVSFHGDNEFDSNKAYFGGAFYILKSTVFLEGNNFFKNNTAFCGKKNWIISKGGAIYVKSSSVTLSGNSTLCNNQGTCDLHLLSRTEGGAIATIGSTLVLQNETVLFENSADNGGAIHLHNSKCEIFGYTSISSNSANNITGKGGAMFIANSPIHVNAKMIMFQNSADKGGGIFATNVTASFEGYIYIINNTARSDGGGIFFNFGSRVGGAINMIHYNEADHRPRYFITLRCPISIIISKNKAYNNGGGVYIGSKVCDRNRCSDIDYNISCPFQVSKRACLVKWVFDNNMARNAGLDMFGGSLNNCGRMYNFSWLPSHQLYRKLYSNDVRRNKTTISSKAMKVCLCDHNVEGCTDTATLRVHRGQIFTVCVRVVGVFNLPVESKLDFPENNQTFLTSSVSSTVLGCQYVSFQSQTDKKVVWFALYPKRCDSIRARFVIKLNIRNCPAGFVLNGSMCHCNRNLAKITGHGELCEVKTGLVKRPPNGWIKSILDNDTYLGFVWVPNCPKRFCKKENKSELTWLNFSSDLDADKLCVKHHTGVVCGACKPKYSLLLTSLECSLCYDDKYLSLIIVFISAGIVLIAVLSLLHMTVATGTINGLIFYANVVNIFNGVIFPFDKAQVNLLTIFVSWINLDFGIPVCFYNGLDAYSYTWLQFVFPFYLWLLVGTIIVMCKYSRRAVKLLGSNPVAVLATVILMSYTKLLHTSQEALSYITLTYSDNRTEHVWRADPNVGYFRGKHAILAVAAVCVMLLLVPYVILLLFGCHLLAFSNKRGLHWVNRFKPLLDAYYAPYTPKMRYWTGLLLVVRTFLSICYSIIRDNESYITLTIPSFLLLTIVFIPWLCKIYHKWCLNFLEATFLINLMALAITYYIKQEEGHHIIIRYISTGIVLTEFLIILAYHIHFSLQKLASYKNILGLVLKKVFSIIHSYQPISCPKKTSSELEVLTTYVDVRESLLAESTS